MKEGYGQDYNDAQPGDIIMGYAIDLSHPAFLQGLISCNALILGSVRGFIYKDWHTGNKYKSYDGVVRNQERLIVDWMSVADKSGDEWKVINPPSYYCKVVAKKGDRNILGINIFVQHEIMRHFYHVIDGGWKRRLHEICYP